MSANDKGDIVVGTFLDFSKVFDTVNHAILLKKLQCYGIRGSAQRFLEDYLDQMTQFVSFQGPESKNTIIKCGVPQGSILVPLLFILYINDIASISDHLLPIIFVDDTLYFIIRKIYR